MQFTYLQDPGHGWLIVPASLVRDLGVTPSHYSYIDRASGYAYLEEDCDAGAFMRALRATGVQPVIQEVHTPRDAKCRALPRWSN
jgi:hypothetical protein